MPSVIASRRRCLRACAFCHLQFVPTLGWIRRAHRIPDVMAVVLSGAMLMLEVMPVAVRLADRVRGQLDEWLYDEGRLHFRFRLHSRSRRWHRRVVRSEHGARGLSRRDRELVIVAAWASCQSRSCFPGASSGASTQHSSTTLCAGPPAQDPMKYGANGSLKVGGSHAEFLSVHLVVGVR
jgi:hypothetical protein